MSGDEEDQEAKVIYSSQDMNPLKKKNKKKKKKRNQKGDDNGELGESTKGLM